MAHSWNDALNQSRKLLADAVRNQLPASTIVLLAAEVIKKEFIVEHDRCASSSGQAKWWDEISQELLSRHLPRLLPGHVLKELQELPVL